MKVSAKKSFHDLVVWRKAHEFKLSVYKATKNFPTDERFGPASQLRRSAASITANIAEGCGRGSDADFGRFLQMAAGSASEVEYHILVARDLGYIDTQIDAASNSQVIEIKRMLTALIKKLEADR
ncbi:four helix bundle protein [Fuerstiella marisgermanici]|nr:four helix bundle protein [Fuerstiella marisgermanici]